MNRQATSRLKVNPPLGLRPSLEFRRVAELRIDPAYQRSINAAASQTLIRRIAMFWDWGLCQPLAVAKRPDGGLYVVDGQHRLEAARMRGDVDDLPCVVTPYDGAGDEAAAFVALNQQRRPLGKIDLFKAAVAAEDRASLELFALIEAAGLKMAPHTNCTAWKPGMVSNIAGIQDAFRAHGAGVTGAALRALAAAFAGQVLRYAGTIFPGVAGLVANEVRIEGSVDADRLTAVLAASSQAEWKKTIAEVQAETGTRRNVAATVAVTRAYGVVAAAPPAPAEVPAPPVSVRPRPAPAPAPIAPPRVARVDPKRMFWCEQCDARRGTEQCKDGSRMGVGMPEYLLLFRKVQSDRSRGYADVPVVKAKPQVALADTGEVVGWDDRKVQSSQARLIGATGYSRSRWQNDAAGYWRSSGNRSIVASDLDGLQHDAIYRLYRSFSGSSVYDHEAHVALTESMEAKHALPTDFALLPPQSWHPEVWTDVARMLGANTAQAAKGREMHLCPLPFDIVDRSILGWSNPGDLIFDPFGGLMTVPLRAVKHGRRGAANELHAGYFADGVRLLREQDQGLATPSLFDLVSSAETLEAAE